MKLNPGLLKLDLFCKGMKIDNSCNLEEDARIISRTRGGLGSGLEIILPDDLYINVPVVEKFVESSPYKLIKENGKYSIIKNGEFICAVKIPKEPKFYFRKTSSGKLMHKIGVLQGTYLGIYPTKLCQFWTLNKNCRFCSVGLNLGVTEEQEKSVKEVVETVKAARKEEKITFVHFNTGFDYGNSVNTLIPYIKAVKEETGLLIGVQSLPMEDLSIYDDLKKYGVNHLSFCVEVYDPDRFKEICPGKYEYLGQKKFFETMKYCVKLFGKGKVAGEIIAGLESPQSTIDAIEYMGSYGVISTVCIFRPTEGTALESVPPPKTEDMIPVFRKMYEVCLKYGIPVGIAPNIKVSIVILPFEGKYFLEKLTFKQRLYSLKLSLMKAVYRTYFNTKLIFK
ncbi:MAG: radical SAM protein [Candidatus Helarchaeota archaeon]